MQRCQGEGQAWTAPRARVYELLLGATAPLTAYDLIARYGSRGSPVSPPTVYRALEFLVAFGLVHRIEGANAFIACLSPGRPHGAGFLICDCCGRVEEQILTTLPQELVSDHGFRVRIATLELQGLCPACRSADGHDGGGCNLV